MSTPEGKGGSPESPDKVPIQDIEGTEMSEVPPGEILDQGTMEALRAELGATIEKETKDAEGAAAEGVAQVEREGGRPDDVEEAREAGEELKKSVSQRSEEDMKYLDSHETLSQTQSEVSGDGQIENARGEAREDEHEFYKSARERGNIREIEEIEDKLNRRWDSIQELAEKRPLTAEEIEELHRIHDARDELRGIDLGDPDLFPEPHEGKDSEIKEIQAESNPFDEEFENMYDRLVEAGDWDSAVQIDKVREFAQANPDITIRSITLAHIEDPDVRKQAMELIQKEREGVLKKEGESSLAVERQGGRTTLAAEESAARSETVEVPLEEEHKEDTEASKTGEEGATVIDAGARFARGREKEAERPAVEGESETAPDHAGEEAETVPADSGDVAEAPEAEAAREDGRDTPAAAVERAESPGETAVESAEAPEGRFLRFPNSPRAERLYEALSGHARRFANGLFMRVRFNTVDRAAVMFHDTVHDYHNWHATRLSSRLERVNQEIQRLQDQAGGMESRREAFRAEFGGRASERANLIAGRERQRAYDELEQLKNQRDRLQTRLEFRNDRKSFFENRRKEIAENYIREVSEHIRPDVARLEELSDRKEQIDTELAAWAEAQTRRNEQISRLERLMEEVPTRAEMHEVRERMNELRRERELAQREYNYRMQGRRYLETRLARANRRVNRWVDRRNVAARLMNRPVEYQEVGEREQPELSRPYREMPLGARERVSEDPSRGPFGGERGAEGGLEGEEGEHERERLSLSMKDFTETWNRYFGTELPLNERLIKRMGVQDLNKEMRPGEIEGVVIRYYSLLRGENRLFSFYTRQRLEQQLEHFWDFARAERSR